MTKAGSKSEWDFDQLSGDAVFVKKADGECQSKTRLGEASDVIFAEPDENSNNIGNKGVPEEKADIDHKVSLLKQNGTEKFDHDDYEGALADFNVAYIIEPQCALTLKYRAEIKRILCQYKQALEDLNLANEIQPNDVFTIATRGTVKKELKDFKDALKDLDRANELDSNNFFIKIQRGVVKRSLGDIEGALVDLNAALALKPDNAFILAQLGVAMRELGRFKEGLKYLDKAHVIDSKDNYVYQQRSLVRRGLGDLEGALDDLNMAYRIIPKDSYTLRRRGVTRRELLDYQGSLEDLNMANKLEPYNDFTLTERGVTRKALGDFRGALEDLTMANQIKGGQAFALKHRGSTNRELGNHVEALQDLTCADHLEPNDFFTLMELGMTKKLNLDYEGALLDYNKVLEMECHDFSVLLQRGSLKRILGDYKGALEDLNKVAELHPKLSSNITLATVMERCFTKYAMKDVAGALQDAKVARNLWGEHGRSSITGEKLKLATTCQSGGLSEWHASSMSQKLNDIEKSTSSHILWIEHQKLLFLKDLGRGSYGYVQKCKWVDTNKDVAVKYVPISSQSKDAFEYEVRMLAKIQHPRVVSLIGCSYNNEEKQGLLVMELMQWNLRSLIDDRRHKNGLPFDLPVAVEIMTKIAEAMKYLHDQGVLHRDLKSSNVLVNRIGDGKEEYIVKIADFGMAKLQGENNMPYFMTFDVGATLWRAPEVFKNEACQKYSFPADVWSFGITCFEILTGEVPFEGLPCAQIRHQVLGGYRPKLPASCPNTLKSLLMKCWSLVPCERPVFSDIHKFLKLYLETITSKDFCDLRSGDAIQPQKLRRHSV